MTNDGERALVSLFTMYIFFGEEPVEIFCSLKKIGLFSSFSFFFFLRFKSSLHILVRSLLSDVLICKYFLPGCDLSFHLSIFL